MYNNTKSFWSTLGTMEKVQDSDFDEVINELGPDDLQRLFYYLGLDERDIEHAEASANTTDSRLKARKVLSQWRKIKGNEATVQALKDAKDKIFATKGRPIVLFIKDSQLALHFL